MTPVDNAVEMINPESGVHAMEKPTTGIWKSGNGFPDVMVTRVDEFADAKDYFLAQVTVDGDPMDLELDPDEWKMFTEANALAHS